MSNKSGKLLTLAGIAAFANWIIGRKQSADDNPFGLSWSGGGDGGTGAPSKENGPSGTAGGGGTGDDDWQNGIGPIIADTEEGNDALDEPVRDMSLPRGIRNANPGNIRRTGTPWRGKSEKQGDDAFVQFDQPVMGIRALARTLETYRDSYSYDTVREIIDRWAPPNENNTSAYVRAVAREMGIGPDQRFSDTERNNLKLIKAIIRHENGRQPYPDSLILDGIRRA